MSKKINLFFAVIVLIIIGFVTSFSMGIAAQDSEEKPIHPWGYEGGTGPLHWGEMEQDHEKHLMCREGVRQSPINIDHVPGFKLGKLHTHYIKTPLRLINNTHTIMLDYQEGSFVEWEGETFDLIQVHFHYPSEHLVNGKTFPMEIHLVHKTLDHQYVVIAIFAKFGKENPTIQKIWDNIPKKINQETTIEKSFINAEKLLPPSKAYFFYNGSLTTPPCSENVTWFVLEEPIEIHPKQIRVFKKYIKKNARPVQKLNHRIVVKLQ